MYQRLTKQKKIILECLKNSHDHPTADEIYNKVRKQLPRVSLGTIYRNLDLLSKHGLLEKIYIDGFPNRYEYKSKDHIHIRCIECGRIDDIVQEEVKYSEDLLVDCDFEITGHTEEYLGKCPECRKKGE